jgi:hypothetical protein
MLSYMQVCDVFQSLQAYLPTLNIVLANGTASVRTELSLLSGSSAIEPVAEESLQHDHLQDHAMNSNGEEESCEDDGLPEHVHPEHGNAVRLSLHDLLPFDRKLLNLRGNRTTVDELVRSVVVQHMEQQETVHTAGLSMHGCSMWRQGHLKPKVVSVAVVTPGRLVHHLQELGHSWLANLEILVRTAFSFLTGIQPVLASAFSSCSGGCVTRFLEVRGCSCAMCFVPAGSRRSRPVVAASLQRVATSAEQCCRAEYS